MEERLLDRFQALSGECEARLWWLLRRAFFLTKALLACCVDDTRRCRTGPTSGLAELKSAGGPAERLLYFMTSG